MNDKNNKNKLSAVIITKNEARNIRRCLQSIVQIADDIVIIDSHSTDETAAICKEFNTNFITHEWMGYAKTKNYGHSKAKYDWILSLDADEALSTELAEAILNLKTTDKLGFYRINRITNYCGKWIKHSGWFPERKLRLFNKNDAAWEGDYVHEKLVVKGDPTVKNLPGLCYHYSYNTIEQHMNQANHYSSLSAMKMLDAGKKPALHKILFSAWFRFIQIYILRAGFKDGFYGFCIAVISAQAKFLRYAKLYQLRRQSLKD